MERTTKKQLQYKVDSINTMLKRKLTPWTTKDGKNTANIGTFYIDGAYGKLSLEEVVNEGGGVHTHFSMCAKRELWDLMSAFIKGLDFKRSIKSRKERNG